MSIPSDMEFDTDWTPNDETSCACGTQPIGRATPRLGVPRRQAIRHAKSRKSYWHMAKTIASGVGFTNALLAELGLLSLKHLWNELAPLRRTS